MKETVGLDSGETIMIEQCRQSPDVEWLNGFLEPIEARGGFVVNDRLRRDLLKTCESVVDHLQGEEKRRIVMAIVTLRGPEETARIDQAALAGSQ
jgi:hypothetical protein